MKRMTRHGAKLELLTTRTATLVNKEQTRSFETIWPRCFTRNRFCLSFFVSVTSIRGFLVPDGPQLILEKWRSADGARHARLCCKWLRRKIIMARQRQFSSWKIGDRSTNCDSEPRLFSLYCSVDETLYFPEKREIETDLNYLGTYSDDRQPTLETLLTPKQTLSWQMISLVRRFLRTCHVPTRSASSRRNLRFWFQIRANYSIARGDSCRRLRERF
ncbi:hypothetical protein B1R32_11049 [Abditibacterium utsteinense]|uniref:Uncharacterized protein n=1 Tax=Abditibacterium utsteinense TaxID=1960156 RepID=A0A2S8SS37_9BACT|nr:hypothetical protein B1R32_11049 [Abditibacterium utsteinense]